MTRDVDAEKKLERRQRRRRRLLMLGVVALAGAAVAQELSKPERQRSWTGRVGGLVPYDLRWPPTAERFEAALWNPRSSALLRPHPIGVGWTVNFAEVARQLRLATTPDASR
ncbi:MAG: hypothetical protein ACRDMV_00160 [Streptosporangiales bacterium]